MATPHGEVSGVVELRPDMLAGHLRIPHGWWFPELIGSVEGAGAHEHNDVVLIADGDDHLDREQGVPQLEGFAGAPRRRDAGGVHVSRADELKLLARERRAAVEQALLDRALRNHKGPVDRVVTRLVMTQIPDVPDDQTGGAPGQRGRLDAPPRRPGSQRTQA